MLKFYQKNILLKNGICFVLGIMYFKPTLKFRPVNYKIIPFLFLLLFLHSCQKDSTTNYPTLATIENSASDESAEILLVWNNAYLAIEKDLRSYRPSASARTLGYLGIAAYETVLPGMKDYISNAARFRDLKIPNLPVQKNEINWLVALNTCMATSFRYYIPDLSPEQQLLINNTESEMNTHLRDKMFANIFANSVNWGNAIAQAVINYSETDLEGFHQARVAFPTNYIPPVGDGKWQPTAPDYTPALFPYWGSTRAFVASVNEVPFIAPYPFSTDPESEYYKQHKALNDEVQNISDEKRWQAEFWSDDIVGLTFSPPARLIAIANQVISLEDMKLPEALHFNCKLGIAINDAAVLAWGAKYTFNTERPESYIKKYINPNFESILGEKIGIKGLEPPFPGYPSGHATFAGVNAGIFNAFFGNKYTFTDNSHLGRTEFLSEPRTYRSWDEMAAENAYSRIPLGVHIKMDCDEGLRIGYLIAKRVANYNLKYQ